MRVPWGPLGITLLAWAVFNAYTARRLRSKHPAITPWGLRIQIATDLVLVTVVLTLTGGATNPFVSIYLVPIAISAAILPRADTWIFAALAVGAYGLLIAVFQVGGHGAHADVAQTFHLHVIGMWIHFILAAGLVAGFVAGMSATVRRRERELAEARERALRDEQLVALGALAASTAHEMGSPLGTMALLLEDLEQECPGDAPRRTIQAMYRQIGRCREALGHLSTAAGGVRMDGGGRQRADHFLLSVLDRWRGLHPEARVRVRRHGDGDPPMVLAERTLAQAIASLLDNALRFGGPEIDVTLSWDAGQVILEIHDEGPGLAGFRETAPDEPTHPGRLQGLGIGLFLARAVIERLGGRLDLRDRPEGGLTSRVELPVT